MPDGLGRRAVEGRVDKDWLDWLSGSKTVTITNRASVPTAGKTAERVGSSAQIAGLIRPLPALPLLSNLFWHNSLLLFNNPLHRHLLFSSLFMQQYNLSSRKRTALRSH